jgi:hypothetical protein
MKQDKGPNKKCRFFRSGNFIKTMHSYYFKTASFDTLLSFGEVSTTK